MTSVQTRYLTRTGPAVDPWPSRAQGEPAPVAATGARAHSPLASSPCQHDVNAAALATSAAAACQRRDAQRPHTSTAQREQCSAQTSACFSPSQPSLSLLLLLPFASLPLSLSLPTLSSRSSQRRSLFVPSLREVCMCTVHVRYRAGLCPSEPVSTCGVSHASGASPLSSLQ